MAILGRAPTEYQLKAACVFRFSQVVEWVCRAVIASAKPFAIDRLKGVCAVWLLVAVGILGSTAQAAPVRDYQIKAVFLFRFTQFVDWPPQAFPETQTPLVIGVLGEDPFDTFLEETVRGERVNNRPLVVQRYRRVEEIQTCHVLFIGQSEASHLDHILADLRGRNILTVGDIEGFARRGGMIQFVTDANKIRLLINIEAGNAANLTISSKLLRPAEIVSTETK